MRLTGSDLDEWARRKAAEGELPELVRRLIHATLDDQDLVRLVMPADEGIAKPGVDGWVETRKGNTFIPAGASVWEVGRNDDFQRKANSDYRSRTFTRPPPGVDLAQTTFVFVTPRRWVKHEEWELQRREERRWKDVRIYDADTLIDWIHRAPAVWAWFAELLGRPGPLRSLQWCWREWSLATDPPCSEGLVLAGRREQCERLLTWLGRPASALAVHAADVRDVAAFCWAALRGMPTDEREAWLARTVVVSGDDELSSLALERRPLLLIARGCRIEVGGLAAAAGHHVILARSGQARRGALELPPLDLQRAEVELERMGLQPEHARKLILEVRGALPGGPGVSMTAIRRKLGGLDGERHDELAPLVLVGAWTDEDEDVEAVCKILGAGPERLRDLQRRHSGQPDSPLVRVGDGWRWTSRRDAWQQLGRRLQPAELSSFAEVFVATFAVGGLRGSSELRRGLLEGLALLAVEADALPPAHDGGLPEWIVGRVLRPRKTMEQWAELGGSLAALAEAAPRCFLDCAHRVISVDGGARIPSDLISALEVLAWPEEHFCTAVELLARIVGSAEQGAIGKQALQSLCEIYRPWGPGTAASGKVREAVLDTLGKKHPRITVELMLELASGSDVSMGTRRPRYRDWVETAADEPARVDDVRGAYLGFEQRLLDLASHDPRHWAVILRELDKVSAARRPAALEALSEIDDSKLDSTLKEEIRQQVRAIICLHRHFPEEKWYIPDVQLERLEALHERLAPEDVRDDLAYVFDAAPTLLHPPRPDASGAEPLAAPEQAARRLADELSPTELVAFSDRVGNPYALGLALGCIDGEARTVELVRASVAGEHPGAREFRRGLGSALFRRSGLKAWNSEAIAALPALVKADLLLGHPSNPEVWDLVASLDSEVGDSYWRHARALYPHEPEDLERVLRSLLRYGRPWAAAKLAASARATGFAAIQAEFIIELLDAASQASEDEVDVDIRLAKYLIHELFDQLKEDEDRWCDDLVRLEWALLSTFDFHRRHPYALYEALATDPELYMRMVRWAYPRRQLPDDEQADAARASELLAHWNLLPGQRPDGDVDITRLRAWLRVARAGLRDLESSTIVDSKLGEALGNSPEGSDGVWPHEAVREILEELGDAERVEAGLFIQRRNRVSMQISTVDPERDQDRAKKLREEANLMRTRWPSTARVLDRLAQCSDDDARFWIDDRRRREQDWTPPATTTHRVEAFLDDLQANGRYVFEFPTLAEAVGDQPDLLRALVELPSVAQIAEDAYVIVRPEYRRLGAPPPAWYIDALMTRETARYCVGLLSAAALYGAGAQQPQIFQVLIDRPREPAKIGWHTIEFVAREREQAFTSVRMNTETGFMLVATPEATIFDLAEFADRCGGKDAVICVLEELAEDLLIEDVAATANAYPPAVVEQAAELLDEAGHRALATSLRQPALQPALGA